MNLRTLTLLLMTVVSLAANANPCDDGGIGGTGLPTPHGIGGTGINPDHEGIGGTGVTNTQKGIGGTGSEADGGIGGTGIVGVITGFGSICVNNIEVHFFTDTPIELDGKHIGSEALSIGQVVAVRAAGGERELFAKNIHVYHQISGPVTSIDVNGNRMKVMGQNVSMSTSQLNGMQVGQWVNVSGLRKVDGSLVATRVDPTSVQKSAQVTGQLERKGNQYYIDGTKLSGLTKINQDMSKDARVTGTWDGNALNVRDVTVGPVSNLLQRVDKFVVQGYINTDLSHGKMMLNGQQMSINSNTQIKGNGSKAITANNPVVVQGQVKEGKPTALSISPQKGSIELTRPHDANTSTLNSNPSSHKETKTQAKEKVSKEDITNEKTEAVDIAYEADVLERTETLEKVETPEKSERVEQVETPEKLEHVEKVEKTEHVEKVEKVEKIERTGTY